MIRIKKVLDGKINTEKRIAMGAKLLNTIGIKVGDDLIDKNNENLKNIVKSSVNGGGIAINTADYDVGRRYLINIIFWILCMQRDVYVEDYRLIELTDIYKNYYLSTNSNGAWYNVYNFVVSDLFLFVPDMWIITDVPFDFRNAVIAGIKKRVYYKKFTAISVNDRVLDQYSFVDGFKIIHV